MIDGYELCSRVLDRANGDASQLLELAGGQETDWLELKAACEPLSDRLDGRDDIPSHRWHVARAAIALANHRGGCLLLGVNDAGYPVGLSPSDPGKRIEKEGLDAFFRHLHDAVICPKHGWKLKGGRKIRVADPIPEGRIEYRHVSLDGTSIAAILVKPVPRGTQCLLCVEEEGDRAKYFMPLRLGGEVGRVREVVDPREIMKWEKERQPASARLTRLLRRHSRRRRIIAVFAGLTGMAALALLLPIDWPWKDDPIVEIQVEDVKIGFFGNRSGLTEQRVAVMVNTFVAMMRQPSSSESLESVEEELIPRIKRKTSELYAELKGRFEKFKTKGAGAGQAVGLEIVIADTGIENPEIVASNSRLTWVILLRRLFGEPTVGHVRDEHGHPALIRLDPHVSLKFNTDDLSIEFFGRHTSFVEIANEKLGARIREKLEETGIALAPEN